MNFDQLQCEQCTTAESAAQGGAELYTWVFMPLADCCKGPHMSENRRGSSTAAGDLVKLHLEIFALFGKRRFKGTICKQMLSSRAIPADAGCHL